MKEAWGRFGRDDEAGAAGGIEAAAVLRAAGLVKTGQAISLAQPISAAMPTPKARPAFAHFMTRDGGDYAAGRPARSGFQFADDTFMMSTHTGTHLDALCHCWYEDTLYNGFAATEVRSDGARRCAIEKLPPIATRGLFLDFVGLAGRPLEDGFTIGAAMMRDALARAGVAPGEGDAVLLRTGWYERQAQDGMADFDAEPGLDVEAAMILAEAGVALIGADNYAIEVLPFPAGTVFPVHQRLIRDYGISLLEGMALKDLAEAGRSEFLFVAAALPIKGATGSPVNPVAIL